MKRLLFAIAALSAGCGDDGGGALTTTTSGEDSSSSSGTSADEATSTTGGPSGALAENIRITLVEANQGVAVNIAQGQTWVGPEGRNARLIRDRPLLLRALYEVDPDWEARGIAGVLELGDGSEQTQVITVAGDANPADLETNFSWLIAAEDVYPSMTFRVRLEEADENGVEVNPEVVVPEEPALVGIEDVVSTLDVVLVPVNVEGCATNPEITDEIVELTRRSFFELHPLQAVNVSVRESPIIAQPPEVCSVTGVDSQLAAARIEDGAAAETVYFLLHGECSTTSGCGCLALGIGSRDAQTKLFAATDEVELNLKHCGGLALGRRHVACNGSEPGVDPDYPYEGGDIGVYGYSVETHTLYPPDSHSYLSFCGDTWVSDYGWEQMWDLLQTPV